MQQAKTIATILAAAAALTAGGLSAQPPSEDGAQPLTPAQHELWRQLDTNLNGVISQREAFAHPDLARRFKRLDRNQDLELAKSELARFEIPDRVRWD